MSERIAFFLIGVAAVLFLWSAREAWRQVRHALFVRYVRRVIEQSREARWN